MTSLGREKRDTSALLRLHGAGARRILDGIRRRIIPSSRKPGGSLGKLARQQTKAENQDRHGGGQRERAVKSGPPPCGAAQSRPRLPKGRPRSRQFGLEEAVEQPIDFVGGSPRFSRINGGLHHRTHNFVSNAIHLAVALPPRSASTSAKWSYVPRPPLSGAPPDVDGRG